MRAVVTGGAGFIGSHLVDLLIGRGWSVTVLDSLDGRVHGDSAPDLAAGAELVRGDIRDADSVDKALRPGADAVFHQAAMVGVGRGEADSREYHDVNVRGTTVLLDALAALEGVPPRLVLASSMAIYGEGAYRCPTCREERKARRKKEHLDRGEWEPRCQTCDAALEPIPATESHPQRPATGYARSKALQESESMARGRELGIPVVALRYHNVYGARMPRDTPYAGVASIFRSRLADGKSPVVHEDGGQLRDFIRVEDVARCNLLAAEAPVEMVRYETFNVATGQPRTIMALASSLCRSMSSGILPTLSNSYREGDPRHIIASPAKARRLLGFEASIWFDEGVERFSRESLRAPPREVVVC